ncbi:MAG: hypothetical protein N3G75_09290, partial [Methanothrix sp.]
VCNSVLYSGIPRKSGDHSMMDVSGILKNAAHKFKQALEERIDSGVPPPNAPSTIMRKGHDLTLRDTWTYRNSIEIRVSDRVAEIGVFHPKVAEYVFYNEHGTSKIPARPVFGPVFDGPGQRILDELEEELADMILDNV